MTEKSDKTLGRLESVEIQSQWPNEQTDFTPWLAKQENLEFLSKTLRLNLELEAVEQNVGEFRADIVCSEVGSDHPVLIENQIRATDHRHLGQLLTYAAGLQAVTIVWLAAPFRNEHRAALDWLNNITDEQYRFFGLEVELWRIGDSRPAPKFNIISQPNDWSRSVVHSAGNAAELTKIEYLQKEYWSALLDRLRSKGGPVASEGRPGRRSWTAFRIGRAGFHLAAVTNSKAKWTRAELYIRYGDTEQHFGLLQDQKGEIEKELGHSLEWEELPHRTASRIACYLRNTDPSNKNDWPRQHEWLSERLNKMHSVFFGRVQDL